MSALIGAQGVRSKEDEHTYMLSKDSQFLPSIRLKVGWRMDALTRCQQIGNFINQEIHRSEMFELEGRSTHPHPVNRSAVSSVNKADINGGSRHSHSDNGSAMSRFRKTRVRQRINTLTRCQQIDNCIADPLVSKGSSSTTITVYQRIGNPPGHYADYRLRYQQGLFIIVLALLLVTSIVFEQHDVL
ncbi:hypothetical protein DFH29DRAFT_1008127 [Suillus ampliporus]|nr:hypothetical protein DFH29DRAFT_1008127 [Suillus ampliporus]